MTIEMPKRDLSPFLRAELVTKWHSLANVGRQAVFGPAHERTLPLHMSEDASWPFAGFVGIEYRRGGTLLALINPGGGGDAYRARTPSDQRFYSALHRFRNCSAGERVRCFEEVQSVYGEGLQAWNVWRIISPALTAAGESLDTVAVVNVVPYRTRGDKLPPAEAIRNAWQTFMIETLKLLEPSHILALGMKAGNAIAKMNVGSTSIVVIPRTIGDTYLSPGAVSALAEFARARRR